MSVLIKGMDMPPWCYECPLAIPPEDDDDPLWTCGANGMKVHQASTEECRPFNCPLVEVDDSEVEWIKGMNGLYHTKMVMDEVSE